MPKNFSYFLQEFVKGSRFVNVNCEGRNHLEILKKSYQFYFGVHHYPAIPIELSEEVYKIYSNILGTRPEYISGA